MGVSANNGFWRYNCSWLGKGLKEWWGFLWKNFGWAVVVMIVAALVPILWPFPATLPEAVTRFHQASLGDFVPLVVVIVLSLLVFLIRAPFRLHRAQQSRIQKLGSALKEARARNVSVEPQSDMNGKQVREYMAANSGIETGSEIETELSLAALESKIKVWAMANDDHRFLPVPAEVFRNHTFYLREEVRRLIGTSDPETWFGEDAFRTGGSIVRVKTGEVVYRLPQFSRLQIESLWPPKQSASET
jgi:low affinity Fe/Cu permease